MVVVLPLVPVIPAVKSRSPGKFWNAAASRPIDQRLSGTVIRGSSLATSRSTTAATALWIQVLTGTAPTTGTVTGNGGATFTVSGATAEPISQPFCGVSTGSAIIGAYGFGIEYADLATTDKLVALDGVTYQPPNNVTFTVYGLVSGEDRVLVASPKVATYDLQPEMSAEEVTDRLCEAIESGRYDEAHKGFAGAALVAHEAGLAAEEIAAIEQAIRRLHAYDVPEILVLPVAAGLPEYLEWIRAETGSGETRS